MAKPVKINPVEVETVVLSPARQHSEQRWVVDYALWCARHADSGREFAALLAPYLRLDDEKLLKLMTFTGYDGFLLVRGRQVLGHLWYQRRDDEIRVFEVWLAKEFRRSLRDRVLLDLLRQGQAMPGVRRIRLGGEMHARLVDWILRWLQRRHGDLGIASHQDGVITLAR